MKTKIAIAQIDSKLGDVKENLSIYKDYIAKAKREYAKLIIFPELSLTGYNLDAHELTTGLNKEIRNSLVELAAESNKRDVDIIASYPTIGGDQENDQVNYISSTYFSRGFNVGTHHKIYLADYGHCNDHITYSPGSEIHVIETQFGKIAMLICEDGWHPTTAVVAAQKGADIIIDIAATSVVAEEEIKEIEYRWETVSKAIGLTQTCYFIYANRIGRENNVLFWGGSHVVNPKGEIIKRAENKAEQLCFFDFDDELLEECRKEMPLVSNEKNTVTMENLSSLK